MKNKYYLMIQREEEEKKIKLSDSIYIWNHPAPSFIKYLNDFKIPKPFTRPVKKNKQ